VAGIRGRGRRLAAAVWGAIALGGFVYATEPVEAVRVVPVWLDDLGAGGLDPPAATWVFERPLRLTISPLVDLSAAELSIVLDDRVVWRGTDGEGATIVVPPELDPGRPGRTIYRIPIEPLAAGSARTWILHLRAPPEGGSVAVFAIEATLPDGRTVRDAASLVVGAPRAAPHRRFGAIEFPAATSGPGPP